MRPNSATGRLTRTRLLRLLSLAVVGTCARDDVATGPRSPDRPPTASVTAAPAVALGSMSASNVLVGAGQIADSNKPNSPFTANLLDTIPGTVFTLGDNAYQNGSATAFTREYDPYWGRQKARTRPTPGNHDWETAGAAGYFGYFGANAGPAGRGYYSYDLGDWHIISLNSISGTQAGAAQEAWLVAELAATTKPCVLAMWHHARFFSPYTFSDNWPEPNPYMRQFWADLYQAHADLIIGGHNHQYERFAPQTPDGGLDSVNGIVQIIAGTGGAGHDVPIVIVPNSVVENSATYGVLKLTLSADGSAQYVWKFIPIAGKTFTDSGAGACYPKGTSVVSAGLSTLAVSPASVSVGGSATVTVTARDANGNPLHGAAVVLAATGSGNTLTQPTATTDANGIATGALSSTVAATKTVSATVSGTAVNQRGTLTVTSATVSATLWTVAAAPATITAGAGSTTITVTAKDGSGNPISGASVVLAATGTGNTLTQPTAGTNGSGVATGTLSSTVAGAKTVSATVSGTALTQTATVTVTAGPVSAAQSTIAAAPASIAAGGATTTITVRAKDANGNPVSGATVVLAVTGTGNTLTQPAALTDASGVATGTLSSTVAEGKTVSATVSGTALTATAAVTVTAGAVSASASTVAAAPASITAGGASTTITVTAKDANGNAVGGLTVILAATGTGNTVTQPTGPTNGNGVATGTISSTVAEPKTVSATVGGTAVTQTAAVTVTAGALSATASTVAAAPASIAAGGGPATITVTAKDGNGNLISGATVVLAATGSGNSVTQPAAGTDGNGVATGTVSSTVAEGKTVSATANGEAVTQTVVVTVTPGAASGTVSTVTAAPASIAAGGTKSTITVTAKDANGNPVAGMTVVLAATGSGNTLTQPAAATDGNGVATGALSSTVAEGKTVSATVSGTGLTQTAGVTVTAGPVAAAQSTVATTPGIIVVGGQPATIMVTARDANGNPVSGATVGLAATGSGNTLAQPVGPTNASGVATGSLGSNISELKTVSATVDGLSLAQTPTVSVGVALTGAGTIATCSRLNDEATANLLDTIPGNVFTTGDNANSVGNLADFTNCYAPSWGRHKARTFPAVGDKEYQVTGAAGYWQYFGAVTGDSGNYYYSYDLGTWHIVVLNSNIDVSAGSPQEQWLRADLAASTKQCTLAYWHYQLFSSSGTGYRTAVVPLWNALYAAGAEIVVNGHARVYERFAPQTPTGGLDQARGIRQFTVGTGGYLTDTIGTVRANSEARNGGVFGVLKLTLLPGSYTWQFYPIAGQSFTDSGSGACH